MGQCTPAEAIEPRCVAPEGQQQAVKYASSIAPLAGLEVEGACPGRGAVSDTFSAEGVASGTGGRSAGDAGPSSSDASSPAWKIAATSTGSRSADVAECSQDRVSSRRPTLVAAGAVDPKVPNQRMSRRMKRN